MRTASDRKRQAIERKLKKLEEIDSAEIDQFIRSSLESPGGRKFLWWLMSIAHIGHNPFANNALTTSFQCGELNIGQQVQTRIIGVDSAGYVRMIQEQQANDRHRQSLVNDGNPDRDDDDDSDDNDTSADE